uniref:GDSL esterase/lipase n=1 Tax=Ananas comosus var. bracteatus TaxID=296719 RepID=A0A6V7NG77_ANACO|nr:unnamed protein product [Ananas comosus var. bracteatus]
MITTTKPQPHSNFSAAFYFGDSTLDTGNNAHISTLVAANHFPYGTDFLRDITPPVGSPMAGLCLTSSPQNSASAICHRRSWTPTLRPRREGGCCELRVGRVGVRRRDVGYHEHDTDVGAAEDV